MKYHSGRVNSIQITKFAAAWWPKPCAQGRFDEAQAMSDGYQ